MRYAIVIEKGEDEFSAYVPDLIGCAASAPSLDEVKARLREEIESRLTSMKDDGLPVPDPTTTVDYIEF